MNKNIICGLIVVLLVSVILFLSFGKNITKPNYMNITGKEAVAMDALIIDVRTKDEFNEKHIKGAQNIPLDEINSIKEKKDKQIIVYCQSGNRSITAAKKLIDLGYTKVYNLGSIDNWTGEFEGTVIN